MTEVRIFPPDQPPTARQMPRDEAVRPSVMAPLTNEADTIWQSTTQRWRSEEVRGDAGCECPLAPNGGPAQWGIPRVGERSKGSVSGGNRRRAPRPRRPQGWSRIGNARLRQFPGDPK